MMIPIGFAAIFFAVFFNELKDMPAFLVFFSAVAALFGYLIGLIIPCIKVKSENGYLISEFDSISLIMSDYPSFEFYRINSDNSIQKVIVPFYETKLLYVDSQPMLIERITKKRKHFLNLFSTRDPNSVEFEIRIPKSTEIKLIL